MVNEKEEKIREWRARRLQAALRGCAEMQSAIEEMNVSISSMVATEKQLRIYEIILIKKIEPLLIFSPELANHCGQFKRYKRFAPGLAAYFGRKKELDVCRTELFRAADALGWSATWVLYYYRETDLAERSFWSKVSKDTSAMFSEINRGNIVATQEHLDSIKISLAQHAV